MSSDAPAVALSSLDEDRFGIRTARAQHVTTDNLVEILQFCGANNVTLLIARCMASDLPVAQAIEAHGGRLMDALLYYSRNLTKTPIPDDGTTNSLRTVRPGDEDAVRQLAGAAFQGYYGHYHADPRLDRERADAAYVSWAERSCLSREVAAEVLLAEDDGRLTGFATLRLNNPDEGEGVLFGVSPAAQGRGIYRSFMIGGMDWCKSQGAARMIVSTQLTNIAVQKVWVRLGFELSHSYYTFHVWFDEH